MSWRPLSPPFFIEVGHPATPYIASMKRGKQPDTLSHGGTHFGLSQSNPGVVQTSQSQPLPAQQIKRGSKNEHDVPRMAFKVAEIAIALGIDRGSVYRLINTGRLRYQRLTGGTILVPASAIEDFLNGAA